MQTLNELRRKLKYHKTISKDLEEQKICDLRSILEFTESMLAEKVTKLEERCGNLEVELQEFHKNQLDSEYVYNKFVDLEDGSRRYNLRVDGATERKGAAWEECKEEVQNVFKVKLSLENIDIEGAHRPKGETSSNKSRTIACKLFSYMEKKEVLKNVKKLKEKVKRLGSKDQIAFFNYQSIIVKGRRNSGDLINILWFKNQLFQHINKNGSEYNIGIFKL